MRIRETASDSPDAYVGASGESKHVQIPGKSYLYLDIQPAHTVDDRGTPTFTGPPSQSFALPSLTGVELMGEWEGHLTAALSLGDYSRYRVFTLTSPNRLVIDVYH
ncbi:hypothetical protein A8W25_16780 [Streptomyces sp. ERV7]|nr:hypothetical protein A8W25_16780 [Streptomyces sp. ERV7]